MQDRDWSSDVCSSDLRKPRPVSDCSFRPWPGAFAINDWTSKTNEPTLHFADAFEQFCIWHWNQAISYPKLDRHTGDDDVQCAFPRVKYNPNLVAMHSALSHDTLIMHTGLNFGGIQLGANGTRSPTIGTKTLARTRYHRACTTILTAIVVRNAGN